MRIFFASLLLSLLFIDVDSSAQSLPVGTPVLEDYYRIMQLAGKVDPGTSFTIRPFYPGGHDIYSPDSLSDKAFVETGPVKFAHGKGTYQILPLMLQQQFNSNHPYGWNDGPMIPAKGYQLLVSGGVFLKYGPLSIQLRPEYVYAANNRFNGFVDPSRPDESYQAYYNYHNQIDWPENFGHKSYNKLSWGQSAINVIFGPIAIGLSNENVWWGPGIRNALILSNNAPGFKHITFNTTRPVKTFLGSFEWQVLAGRLDGSGLPPLDVTTLSDGTNIYEPKSTDWRYFTGFNINYHPRWVTGLVLGLTRTFDAYNHDVKGLSGYLPFFVPYQKANVNSGTGDKFPRDQYTSFYARWLFTKAKAEIYFEYGLNDNSYNLSDFLGSPEHSRAYILGLRKLIPLQEHNGQYILFSTELTQLSQSSDRIVRDAEGWYIHGALHDGQTNLGQILGAGTGSGGNLQSTDISWVMGLKKIGIAFERYEHNVDFSNNAFKDINNNSRKWVDYGLAAQGTWNYKNLLFNFKLEGIKSLNYEWVLKDYQPTNSYYIPHNDVFNLHAELGLTYRF